MSVAGRLEGADREKSFNRFCGRVARNKMMRQTPLVWQQQQQCWQGHRAATV